MSGFYTKYYLSAAAFPNKQGIPLMILFLNAFLATVFLIGIPDSAGMDLADEPLSAKSRPAPPNIMFLLDDSTSMTFEVLIKGKYDGRYPRIENETGEDGFFYIFDYLNDDAITDAARYMGTEGRKFWQSQYYDTNVIYYNPETRYEPWPGYAGRQFEPSDKENPKPHPVKSDVQTIDLDGESFTVKLKGADGSEANLKVKHAHYFITSEEGTPYLVVIDGDVKNLRYYKVVEVEGTGFTQKVTQVEEVSENSLPGRVATDKSYAEERQNFANWFTFHRRRQYVAINAIARVIKKLQGIRVGILGINGRIIVPLKPIGIWKEGVFYDRTGELLHELYQYSSQGDTPLREGLNDIGKYYKNNSRTLAHYTGVEVEGNDPPYFPDADGGACQQSYTIVMTDGYYSYEIENLGVDNADGDSSSDYDGSFYHDALEETLADVAMYYYENDLSHTLANRVYDSRLLQKDSPDKAPHQHMVTYGVAFGVSGTLNPDDYNDDSTSEDYLKDTNGEYPIWPDAIAVRSKDTIDDLYHATVNGRGRYFTAGNPGQLAEALSELAKNILNRHGSSAPLSTNGDTLFGKIDDDVILFQAGYNTNGWTGDIIAYQIDTQTGEVLLNYPKWSAADSLDAKSWEQRNILSYNGSFGIEFNKNQVSDDQKIILGAGFEKIVDFVRGNESIENFRSRTSLLGDIVHSTPIFEEGVIYVGANDGMLHAFAIGINDRREITGEEIFAYIPAMVFDNLASLTEIDFAHKYFVDLTPAIGKGDGLLGGENSGTILIGGLGKGGKGYFALDITNPKSMTPDNVLWEFPAGNDSDMGFSFSKPVIVRSYDEQNPWIVIFGNGYDSPDGKAVLYILNPTGRPGDGLLVKKFDLGGEPDNGLSSPVAVDVNYDKKVDFVYAGDLHGNLWKFDLSGDSSEQWKVACSDGTDDQPVFRAQGPGGAGQPITVKPEVMLHPEKHGLMVLFGTGKFLEDIDITDQRPQSVYGIWDYGDRHYYPGEWGDYSRDDDLEYLGSFTRPQLSNQPDNVTLVTQTSIPYTVSVHGENSVTTEIELRVLSSHEPIWNTKADPDPRGPNGEPSLPDLADDGAGHAGWHWDLPLPGERVVNDVLLRDGRLIVISFTPDSDPCKAGGSSFLMELNSFTGGSAGGALFDIDNDGVVDENDMVVTEFDADGNAVKSSPTGIMMPGNLQMPTILQLNKKIEIKYFSSSTGAVNLIKGKAVRLGMTYWEELEQQ
jgi:type IV pilus assembly protein PilY1